LELLLKKKSNLRENTLALIKDLKAKQGITVKFIQCNYAGENKKLKEACLKEGLGIQFEYTSPGTPQHDGQVERKFATLYGQVHVMFNNAGLPNNLCKGLGLNVQGQQL
jgi:hypothetical protein